MWAAPSPSSQSFFRDFARIADIAANRRVIGVREFGTAMARRLTIGTTHTYRRMASSFTRASAVRFIGGGARGLDRLSTPRHSCSPHVAFQPTVRLSRRVDAAASDRGRTGTGRKSPRVPATREKEDSWQNRRSSMISRLPILTLEPSAVHPQDPQDCV